MPAALVRSVMRRYPRISEPAALPLFCLAPHGVFRASRIAPRAVSSYLAFSPLPALFSKNRRYVFCDTFRRRNFSTATPAYFTRHAAVWCSDFPPASRKGLTSDHLPSARSLPHPAKKKRRPPITQSGSAATEDLTTDYADNTDDEQNAVQKATHLCQGSGAASEGKRRFLWTVDLSLRSLRYLLFKILRGWIRTTDYSDLPQPKT